MKPNKLTAKTKRGKILETALNLTEGDRNNSYGPPQRNLGAFADLLNAYLKGKYEMDFDLNAVDGSVIMNLTKVSRIVVNQDHKDNYIDGAAYMAIAGECAEDV